MGRKNKKRDAAHQPTYNGMHMFGKAQNFDQAQYLNDTVSWLYYNWLLELAMVRFDWQGLPPEIDKRFLELCLAETGLAVFFFDSNYDKFFALQGAPAGKINAYRNPTGYTVYGNGQSELNKRMKATECVPIWNNLVRTPESIALSIYARKLASISRAHDVQVANQKAPIIIRCSESQRLTVTNLVAQWQGNQPIIFGDDQSMEGVTLEYLTPNPKPDYNGSALMDDLARVWAEAMGYLGISNSDIRKAERVQSAEVNANNGQTETSGLITLDTRREACKEINRQYGLDVWVDAATDYSSRNFAALMTAPAISYGVVTDDEI